MNGLTKSLALYGAPYGVRVCCVSPGPVLTRPAMANMKTPLGRAAQPGEIVILILYLSSDKAAFVTGTNYLIDGGRSCGARDEMQRIDDLAGASRLQRGYLLTLLFIVVISCEAL